MKPDVMIIGAGIGGLTVANALQKKHIPFSVFEKSSAIKAVGAGIILPPNAMKILASLGLEKAIRQFGHPVKGYAVMSAQGRTYNRINIAGKKHHESNERTGKTENYSVAIARSSLHHILADALPDQAFHLSKHLTDIDETTNTCSFSDGTGYSYETLVGADGINSVVRKNLLGDEALRDCRQLCYRGLVSINGMDSLSNQFYELWGQGSRFGFVKIADNRFYWYATFSLAISHLVNPSAGGIKKNIEDYFRDWWWPVPALMAAQREEDIIETPLFDRPPTSTWNNTSGVVLMGDAAHPTTPNLGQGAAKAIESAYSLVDALTHGEQNDFTGYLAERQKRTAEITRLSWMIGQIANLRSPTLCRLRGIAMGMTTDGIASSQFQKMVSWLPDSLKN